MLSDEDAKSLTWRLSIISNAEILIWPLLMVPVASSMIPLIALEYGFLAIIPALLGYILFLGAIGATVDLIISVFRGKTRRVDARSLPSLQKIFDEVRLRGAPRLSAVRSRVSPADLSVGGYVRGSAKPRVVISGGMLVGLLRNIAIPKAVLCHEIGHVANGDKFFFSLIALWFGNLVGSIATPFINDDPYVAPGSGWQLLFSVILTFFVLSRLSKRRETMADVYASALCGRRNFLLCLDAASVRSPGSGGLFHPSIWRRRERLELRGTHGLRPSLLIVAYCVASALPGVYSFVLTSDEFYLATATAGGLAIIVELMRLPLFPRSFLDNL